MDRHNSRCSRFTGRCCIPFIHIWYSQPSAYSNHLQLSPRSWLLFCIPFHSLPYDFDLVGVLCASVWVCNRGSAYEVGFHSLAVCVVHALLTTQTDLWSVYYCISINRWMSAIFAVDLYISFLAILFATIFPSFFAI